MHCLREGEHALLPQGLCVRVNSCVYGCEGIYCIHALLPDGLCGRIKRCVYKGGGMGYIHVCSCILAKGQTNISHTGVGGSGHMYGLVYI